MKSAIVEKTTQRRGVEVQPVQVAGTAKVSFAPARGHSGECKHCGRAVSPTQTRANGIKFLPESSLATVPCAHCSGIDDSGAIFQTWRGPVPLIYASTVIAEVRM